MIIGAGPAGISTWLHLQKYAAELAGRSKVIEKAIFPRDKLCAGGLSSWSANILEHLGVELDIPSLYIGDVEFRFGRDLFRFHPPDCFRVIQRIDFDHALVKTAVHRGLELHEDERFIDATRGQGGLLVNTNKRKYIVQALVGADGALSLVRRKMMPPQKPRLAPTLQIFAPVDPQYPSEFNEKKIVVDFTPTNEGLQGYAWHIPCVKNGTPSIAHGICDFRVYADKPRADMKKIFTCELQSRNIRLESRSWSSHPIRWLSGEDIIRQPNVLLVGDAAGIEPALGGGIHVALSYGEVAAHAIIDAFKNDDFSFHDYKKRIQSHSVGKFIAKSTRLALEMYSRKVNPLSIVPEFFTERYECPNLLFLLLSGNQPLCP
jgi:flavin-dependent dehydrogenase